MQCLNSHANYSVFTHGNGKKILTKMMLKFAVNAVRSVGVSDYASRDDFGLLGFSNVPHFTIGNSMVLELTRGRYLTASCIGQGNETIFLGYKDKNGQVTDLVCVHNRDYDGFIEYERLKDLVEWFKDGIENERTTKTV